MMLEVFFYYKGIVLYGLLIPQGQKDNKALYLEIYRKEDCVRKTSKPPRQNDRHRMVAITGLSRNHSSTYP
ncbi:hypothetical protein TNCV_3489161 [Trichonephila clavipes]|nr:hypothetical protein TNCV_3489161 [Trichonephila clavipes]